MNTSRPFSADSNKLAYAQAFSRTSTARRSTPVEHRSHLRGVGARLHRPAKPTR